MSGKCPSCKKTVGHIVVDNIDVSGGFGAKTTYHGVTYQCPSCRTILGVELDPLALKTDIVSSLLKALRKG